MHQFVSIFFLLALFAVCSSCDNDEALPPVTDPKQAILGRWDLVETMYGPLPEPSHYEEYLPDSVLMIYSYNHDVLEQFKYWMEDSLLYKSGTYWDDDGEGTFTYVESFVYEFANYNELGLETTIFAMNRYSGYRRVKQ